MVTVRGRSHWSQHRAVRLLHCPSGSPTDRAHHHPPCRGPCPGACRLGLSCQLLQGEPLRPGVAKPEHGCGPAPPVGSQGALWKVQHMCVFEEQQEFTGCCKAVGPGDWPPGASLGGESRAWPAALPLALRAGEKEAGRGLEGPEKGPRGGFKGQASVSAWPEAQGSPTAFRELQVLPSTEHARPGGLETVSGSVELSFLEGEEPSLEGGASLSVQRCLKRAIVSVCRGLWAPTHPLLVLSHFCPACAFLLWSPSLPPSSGHVAVCVPRASLAF